MNLSLFHYLSKYSIKKQLIFIYITLVFLFGSVIGLYLVQDSNKQLAENYQHLADLNAQRAKSVMFDTTNTIYNTALSLSNNLQLRELLSTHYTNENDAIRAVNAFSLIEEIRSMQTSIADLIIYTSNDTIPHYRYLTPIDDDIQRSPWYQQALTQSDAFFMTRDTTFKANRLSLFKSLPLPLSNEIAIVEIRYDYNYLSNRLRNSSYFLEMQLNDDVIFYSDRMTEVGKESSYNRSAFSLFGDFYETKGGKKVLLGRNILNMNNKQDIVKIYSTDYSAFFRLRTNLIRWIMVICIVLMTALIIFLFFSHFFARRIQLLQEAVYHAAIEDYDFFQNIDGEDEISQISLDFHKIIQRIKVKEVEIIRSRLTEQELLNQQQQMEFSILAGQINPHFLFNTLETIRMMAIRNSNTDVAYAIKLLAKSMRNTLDVHGTDLESLEDALDAIHVYVKIQRMRFGDRVNFSYAVSNQINQKETLILPLLIQPLVENAISHGLEALTSKGVIRVTITKQDEDLLITVQDNGIGIPSERLSDLREKIKDSSSTSHKSIGLQNVHHRAKMYYGEGYGLTISSVENTGTSVILRIKSQAR